jgi:hypothetical protein
MNLPQDQLRAFFEVTRLGSFTKAADYLGVGRSQHLLPSLLQSGQADLIITCGRINLHQYEEVYLGVEISVLVESKKFDDVSGIIVAADAVPRLLKV